MVDHQCYFEARQVRAELHQRRRQPAIRGVALTDQSYVHGRVGRRSDHAFQIGKLREERTCGADQARTGGGRRQPPNGPVEQARTDLVFGH